MNIFVNSRYALLGAASALSLSFGAALADEPGAAEASGDAPQRLVEVGQADAVAINDNDMGTAVQHLAGMTASEIEGMEVFDSSGSRIGTVEVVALDESGGVYVIVSAEADTAVMMAGAHAVPLPRFDYDAEANALVMWDAYATTAATPSPYGTTARLYTVLEGSAEVPAITAEHYNAAARGDVEEPEDTEDIAATLVVDPAEQAVRDKSVEYIVGLDILNRTGDDIGDVENVAHNDADELYLIVSLNDGILGIGDSERAVKLDSFDYAPAEDALVLMDTSEEALEAMPEYDSDTPGYTIIESDLDWARFE